MEKQINLTCKRAERPIEYLSFGEPQTFFQKGYEVYNGDTPVCFISKDDTLGEWNANSFDDWRNCEGLTGGLTKKEVLANIRRLLREGTLYLTWYERDAKRKAEREQDERNHNAIVEYRKEKAEKEAKEVAKKLTQSQLEAINHVWKSFDKYQENNQEVISLENTWVEEDEVAELEAKEVDMKNIWQKKFEKLDWDEWELSIQGNWQFAIDRLRTIPIYTNYSDFVNNFDWALFNFPLSLNDFTDSDWEAFADHYWDFE